jgi:hypothetical protein
MTEARCTRVGFHGFTIADAVAMRSYRHATGIPVGRLIAQACNPVVLALLRFSPRERPGDQGQPRKTPLFPAAWRSAPSLFGGSKHTAAERGHRPAGRGRSSRADEACGSRGVPNIAGLDRQ